MARLTLDQANEIIAEARGEAKERALKPLTYAVVDAGGHLIALARDDGAAHLRNEIATNKAWGSIAFGISSKRLGRHIDGHTNWWVGLAGTAGGRLVPSAGGVFIRSSDGEILGAFGISGEASAIDEEIAVIGIEAAGFVADTEGD